MKNELRNWYRKWNSEIENWYRKWNRKMNVYAVLFHGIDSSVLIAVFSTEQSATKFLMSKYKPTKISNVEFINEHGDEITIERHTLYT